MAFSRIKQTACVAALLIATWAATCVPGALAHNGGILIQAKGEKLVLGLDSEEPGEPPQMGVYVESSLLRPEFYAQDVPSFISLASPPAGTEALPEGTDIFWDFLPMSIDGVTSNLFYWDGQGTNLEDVQFRLVPQSGVTMGIYNTTDDGFPSATVDGSDQMVPGKLIGKTDSSGSGLRLHRHNFFLLDDNDQDPNSTNVPEGAYLIAFQLRMEGFRTTAPFFLVAATFELASTSLSSVDAAIEWVDQQQGSLILNGDYDFDGDVDTDDYLAWRQQFASTGPFPVGGAYADGNRDTVITAADYVLWRDHLGLGVGTVNSSATATAAVPEPTSVIVALTWLAVLACSARNVCRGC